MTTEKERTTETARDGTPDAGSPHGGRDGGVLGGWLKAVGAFSYEKHGELAPANSSRALNRELRGRGVRVMALCPFWTRTAFFARATTEGGESVVKKYVAMYEPEQLVGKTAVAILNLPPRKMMGIPSCGMLISAVHKEKGEEKLNLIMLNDAIPAGAKLC